jgi:excisionase family DNA binding protein
MNEFMTTAEAAKKRGVTGAAVRKWLANGKLPSAEKMGRDWLIPADAQKPVDRRFVENPIRNRRK